jgi:hypothetical protein
MSETVYAYTGTNSRTIMVDDGDINYTGTWSSSGTYSASSKDTVLYGSSRFITLIDNVGAVPTQAPRRNQSAKWSSLVVIRQGTTASVTAAEAYALAGSAYAEAIEAQNTANGAYEIAVAGTEYTDLLATWFGTLSTSSTDLLARSMAQAAQNTADAALLTAWSGTSGANSALQVAAAGTNLSSLLLTWFGTLNTSGEDAFARSLANTALQTAWSGTSGANSAFGIAVAGTTAAAAAQTTAALALTWIGTIGASGVDQIARDLANNAYSIAVNGTDRLDDRIDAEIQARIHGDGTTYWAGTAYTNAAIAAIPASSSGSEMFWAGTNYTNGQVAIEAAARIAGDNAIMGIAVAGTNLATTALTWAGTSVSKSGGTMTGNLHTPMIVLGVGSVPASSGINGTVYYDFLGPAFQETTVDRSFMVAAKNYTAGAEIAAVLISNGTQRAITYSVDFSWFGTQVPFSSTTANKKILVAMASTGTVPSKVIGATTAQI